MFKSKTKDGLYLMHSTMQVLRSKSGCVKRITRFNTYNLSALITDYQKLLFQQPNKSIKANTNCLLMNYFYSMRLNMVCVVLLVVLIKTYFNLIRQFKKVHQSSLLRLFLCLLSSIAYG